ncbi:Epimerase domain-containing protein [Fusarium sp. LHS14.1]|nr:Epimerase domain-containing protein [Fusarium sp. LHS14.1]
MPKVLILGATGYLGKRLADALVRSGQHRVYGIARNEAKAQSLAVAEVTPIICPNPVEDPEAYLNAIREHHIDVIVDVAGANQDSAKFLNHVRQIGQERLSKYKAAGLHTGPKLGFIYGSGTWVHGCSEELVNDLNVAGKSAKSQPPALVAWRTDLENSILAASDILDVAIVRPALIYGRESTIWASFVLPLLQAARSESSHSVEIPLRADSKPGLVHVDDVATGFKRAIEKLSLINGGSTYPVFDLVTSQESMQGIFDALAGVWKFKGKFELVGSGDDLFAEAMSTTMRGSSDRAKQLLGWEPTRTNGFIADMDVYAAAFAAQH